MDMSSWRGAYLSNGYIFMAWCLLKQWIRLYGLVLIQAMDATLRRGAYLSNGCLHGVVLT
jgi:hypothetical protein